MHQRFETVEPKPTRSTEGEPSVSWREQRFTPKEVSEILSIATRLQNEGVKGEQILQMAEEAGIAPEYIERAVIEFQKRKWQRIEAEMNMRRRLRRIVMAGGVLIALTGMFTLLILLGSRSSASHASTPPTQEQRRVIVLPDYTGEFTRSAYGNPVHASSRSLSVAARRTANAFGQIVVEVVIRRADGWQASVVQIPSVTVSQISIAPNEKRIALIDSSKGAVWVVNADGAGLNQVVQYNTPVALSDGVSARPTQHPFAGWDGDDLILHTDKGSVRMRLSEDNTVAEVERYKP